MQLIRRIVFVTGLAGCLLSQSFGQDVNLKGKVLDENGAAVSGAQLTLKKLNYTCTTNDNGEYSLDKSQSPVINNIAMKSTSFIGLTPKFLELGNYFDATITVFSIRGSVVSKLTVNNQNRVAIDKLIPVNLNSQSVIISIVTIDKVTNIKAVKYGSQWVYNNKTVTKASGNSALKHAKSNADIIDTLVVKKDGMKKKQVPLTNLIATLDDIILKYDVEEIDSSKMINDVTFSEPSRTFKEPLSITMTTDIPNAEIRYTTTGELPSSESDIYSEAIEISSTTQLRAAAFVDGKMSGLPSTAIYIARDFDYTSDIPILIMEGYGGGAPPDKYNFINLGVMIFDPVDGKSSLDALPTLSTRAGYHLRGQSSMMMFNQAPYRIELWDNFNEDVNQPVMGMPSDADWALISPCTDNTLIRNVLATEIGKQLGLKTVQYRFCEVFINQDGGPLTASDYEGVYTLFQPVKNKKNTLNLKKLDENDTDPAKITGGYLFKFDNAVKDSGMVFIECTGAKKFIDGNPMWGGKKDTNATCWSDLELVSPNPPNDQQMMYITNYVQEFHDALHANPIGNWKSYIDVESFVNNYILNEITRNVDAWIRSHFMYKDRDGVITAGPVWDYNFAMDNYSHKIEGWQIDDVRSGSDDWHLRMWKQQDFKSSLKKRWNELRPNVLSNETVLKTIDNTKAPITNVAERNFTAWPMGKCTDGGGFGGGFGGGGGSTATTWEGQIKDLKTWLTNRMNSLDTLMAKLP
ncbi:MAG: hypothetical protein GX639_13985 [Fibrobacter sp.]|nr:hypothetical protein [Fibrobacter sp.]